MQNWNVILACSALTWGALNWRRFRQTDRGEGWLGWFAIFAGSAKIWLALGQPQYAVPLAGYDDRIFLRQATHLLEGRWLGPYDQLVLSKGPFYAMFMAVIAQLKFPLIMAHNLVYIVASWLFIRALRPLQLPTWIRAGFLVAIMLCPVLVDTSQFVRAWRQSLWPGLILLAVASTIGLALRENAPIPPIRWQAAWALLSGGSVGAIWLLREEAVWTLPMLALPLLFAGWRSFNTKSLHGRTLWLLIPAVVACLAVAAVSFKNYQAYGFWGVSELRDHAFVAANSALARVPPHDLDRRIPVTREAREKIYQVSSAFASLRDEMEYGIGAKFMYVTQISTDIPALAEREIGGGWFMWAMRTAVETTGQAQSAISGRTFYQRLANEVNAACDDGRLSNCLAPRHTWFSPWHPSYPEKVWRAAQDAINLIIGYPFNSEPIPSLGAEKDFLWVERMTHELVTPADPVDAAALRSPLRLRVIEASLVTYRHLMLWLVPAATAGWLFLVGRALYLRELRPLLVLSTALVLGIAANVAVVAVIDATSFPAMFAGYLGASIPLAVCFVGLVFTELVMTSRPVWRWRRALSPVTG